MKLHKTTIVLVLLALGLGGFVYYFEFKRPAEREAVAETEQQLLAFEEDRVQSIKVKIDNSTLVFERQAQNHSSRWLMIEPESAPASDASVAFLLSKLANTTSDRQFLIEGKQLKDYGLDKPKAIVEIALDTGDIHQLRLGNNDFSNSSLYALVDAEKYFDKSSVVGVEEQRQATATEEIIDREEASEEGESKETETENPEADKNQEQESSEEAILEETEEETPVENPQVDGPKEQQESAGDRPEEIEEETPVENPQVDGPKEQQESAGDRPEETEVRSADDSTEETEDNPVAIAEDSRDNLQQVENRELNVVLIPADFIYAVERPLSEWKTEAETSEEKSDEPEE